MRLLIQQPQTSSERRCFRLEPLWMAPMPRNAKGRQGGETNGSIGKCGLLLQNLKTVLWSDNVNVLENTRPG